MQKQSGNIHKKELIGIRLVPSYYNPKSKNMEQLKEGAILGTMWTEIRGTPLYIFRLRMSGYVETPKEFRFLNTAGWPIDTIWESEISTSDCLEENVITIMQKPSEFKKVGIKFYKDSTIGFIQIKKEMDLSHVRNIIMSELPHKFGKHETFIFLEAHLWPISTVQEENMSLWDLDINSTITIKKIKQKDVKSCEIKGEEHFTSFRVPAEMSNGYLETKILISYSETDGKDYASSLRHSLHLLGLSEVCLGRDFTGITYIEKTNSDVNSCDIFIPLVTRFYAKDEYGRREAKLAKTKGKLIIPISFVENWLFDMITENFQTHVPFITWKIFEDFKGEYGEEKDWMWIQESIDRVSKEIIVSIRKYFK